MSEDMSEIIQKMGKMLKNNEMPDNVKSIMNNLTSNSNNSRSNNLTSNYNNSISNSNNSLTSNEKDSSFKSEQTNKEDTYNSSENNSNENSDSSFNMPNIDLDTMLKMKSIIDSMNKQQNDPRANLLRSLKPYLKPSRKEKIDQYIKLFNIGKAFEVLNPLGGEKKK